MCYLKIINTNSCIMFSQDTSTKTFTSIFAGKLDMLEEKIDTEHGLLHKLEINGVITTAHREAIEVTFVSAGKF